VAASGFQYLLEYDERRDDDLLLELDGLTVVIDPFSAPLLSGTVLEYDGGLGGRGFEFRNPQVEAGCGCGPLLPGQPGRARGAGLDVSARGGVDGSPPCIIV